MYEPITKERLENYSESVRELDSLLKQKEGIKQKIGSLSGIDYSRIKVSSGNGSKISEQEHYVMSLQKINERIDRLRALVIPEHNIIKTQIARVKKWNLYVKIKSFFINYNYFKQYIEDKNFNCVVSSCILTKDYLKTVKEKHLINNAKIIFNDATPAFKVKTDS